MAIEMERKFLVVDQSYQSMGMPHRIVQGYICSENDRVVRVRIYDEFAFITIKNATVGFARDEFEYAIPVADAEAMLRDVCEQPIIEKTRYVVPFAGNIWEVDQFSGENQGLVVAEIELEEREQEFELPPFVGAEVTEDSRYYNSQLFKNPYQNWKSE